jgi:hypothetical protein
VSLDAHRAKILGGIQLVRAHSRATGTPRAVLNVLASYADADGRNVWIGRGRLEEETGLSRSTCRRAIRALEELGELETLEVGTGRRSSRYRLTLSTGGENPVQTGTVPDREGVQSEPAGGSERPREGVHSDPQPVVTGSDREGGAFPDHCPTHRDVEDPPPCRRCGQTREANAAARRSAALAAGEETRRRRLEEDRRRVELERARVADEETRLRALDEIRRTLRTPPPSP